MKPRSCPRLWEVEAARDGRASRGRALGNGVLTHVESCPVCREELARLDALRRRLRDVAPPVDQIAVRRVRLRLFELVDRSRHEPVRRFPALVPLLVLALGFACAVAALSTRFWHAPPAQRLVVVASEGAVWGRRSTKEAEYVELHDGTLTFDVRRDPGGPRLVVRVPDGEVEDIGTVFSVTVSGGRTTDIHVTEGTVVFHRAGSADVAVRPGTPLAHPVDPQPHAAPPTSSATSALSPAVPSLPTSARAKSAAAAPPSVRSSPRAAPSDASPETTATATATATVAAATSDEDALYLRVIELLRAGRRDEAAKSAAEYLRRFPGGFRRLEVEKTLRRSGP